MAALGVYHGARLAEVVRAGIQSVPATQLEAALSTGLSLIQAYRLVLLPIALRLIVPPLTNESLNLLKNSSLALTISVAETTFMTRQIESYTAKGFEALTAGTLIYLGLCLGVSGTDGADRAPGRNPGPHRPGCGRRTLSLDFGVIPTNWRFLLVQGLLGIGAFGGGTLALAIPAIVLGFVLGVGVALARLLPLPLALLPHILYVQVIRGVPLVMVVFWFWFFIPIATGVPLPSTGWPSSLSSCSRRPTSGRSFAPASSPSPAARSRPPRPPG